MFYAASLQAFLLWLCLFSDWNPLVASAAGERGKTEEVAVPDYEVLDEIFFGKQRHRREAESQMEGSGSGSS